MSKTSVRAMLDKLPGIKQDEIKPCALCKKGVAHDGNILFWRLKFDRAGLHVPAIERQHGLELMMGSPFIARVMGTDSDIAKVIDGPHDVWICEPCVMEKLPVLFFIAEEINEIADSAGQTPAARSEQEGRGLDLTLQGATALTPSEGERDV